VTKGAIALALISGVLAIAKLVFQTRALAAAKEADAVNQEKLAKLRADADERAARHAREAAERQTERDLNQKMFTAMQSQMAETLAILRTELRVTQETTSRAFDLLQKNTDATQELARGLTATNAKLDGIMNGAGCRVRGA
jgi:molecular chaperone GrpE (heat shock protein)